MKKIDREYMCLWDKEAEYLISHGVRYVFVKEVDGITQWKFKKTPELFLCLSNFYEGVYMSK